MTPTSGYHPARRPPRRITARGPWVRPAAAAGVAILLAIGAVGCGGATKASSSAAVSAQTSLAGGTGGASSAPVVPTGTARSTVSGAVPVPVPGGSVAASPTPVIGQEVVAGQPKIVTKGDVHMQVRPGHLQQAFDALAGVATGAGGFVSDSSMSSGSGVQSARVVLRVAADQVDRVLLALHQDATVTSQSLSGQDVTGQVVDLAARISTLQAEENALRSLLGSARAIGDILSIQNQLFDLQTQIEQLAGQQSVLADQTAYATISVEVTETAVPTRPTATHHPSGTLARAWHLAGAHSVAVLRAVVLALGWLAPVLLIALAAGLPVLVVWRHRRRLPTRPETGPVTG